MSFELIRVDTKEADRVIYRSRHPGAWLNRLFGVPFIALPGWLFYMIIFRRNPEFGHGTADISGWLQITIVSFFLLIPLFFLWLGLSFTLGVRGIEIDRNEGTIREYSGWIVPWRRTVHWISEFKGVAVRPEHGAKFSTCHALYLVGSGREDFRIDAWDRLEAETEASRVAQFLNLKVIES